MSTTGRKKYLEFLLNVNHNQVSHSDVSAIGGVKYLLVKFNEWSKTSRIKEILIAGDEKNKS